MYESIWSCRIRNPGTIKVTENQKILINYDNVNTMSQSSIILTKVFLSCCIDSQQTTTIRGRKNRNSILLKLCSADQNSHGAHSHDSSIKNNLQKIMDKKYVKQFNFFNFQFNNPCFDNPPSGNILISAQDNLKSQND